MNQSSPLPAIRMTDNFTIFQCEECLRYFQLPEMGESGGDRAGRPSAFVLMAPQPVGMRVLPVSCACGLPDCAGIKARLLEQERACVQQWQRPVVEFWKKKRERFLSSQAAGVKSTGRCGRSLAGSRTGAVRAALGSAAAALKPCSATGNTDRGMPPERDEVYGAGSAVGAIGSSQGEFHAAVDVGPALRRLLDYFTAHFGEFIALPVLEGVCGHHAVNSRCSELRELIPADQDIDQENRPYAATGTVHSHYRLCLKCESGRLKRKVARDAAQGEFKT